MNLKKFNQEFMEDRVLIKFSPGFEEMDEVNN